MTKVSVAVVLVLVLAGVTASLQDRASVHTCSKTADVLTQELSTWRIEDLAALTAELILSNCPVRTPIQHENAAFYTSDDTAVESSRDAGHSLDLTDPALTFLQDLFDFNCGPRCRANIWCFPPGGPVQPCIGGKPNPLYLGCPMNSDNSTFGITFNCNSNNRIDGFGGNCSFDGSIPSSIGMVTAITFLNLSFNNFSGPIPASLSNLQNITDLWLRGNNLNGSIPDSLTQLSFLNSLYVHHIFSFIVDIWIRICFPAQFPHSLRVHFCLKWNCKTTNSPDLFQGRSSV
eukprot:TRINITY_DN1443_c0_g1_i3.p1 TRINITY_DN1443_c0_g1~~TRINITY_DN1443_c0_g1_i3.p1  ORF type:complete len:289 (+),score=12.97 TRINITY_DN1443_c0_g1_i3:143-1009(+)